MTGVWKGAPSDAQRSPVRTPARALRAYERAGFRIVEALVADIGGGFVMDDYLFARALA